MFSDLSFSYPIFIIDEMKFALCFVAFACAWLSIQCFYLPGVTPKDFEEGNKVELEVNSLTSVHTLLPYEYYSLKFCEPEEGVRR